MNLNKYDEAIANFNKALEINPDYESCYHNRAFCYDQLKDFDKAIEDYTKVIEMKPHFLSYYNRGNTYFVIGDLERSQLPFHLIMILKKCLRFPRCIIR